MKIDQIAHFETVVPSSVSVLFLSDPSHELDSQGANCHPQWSAMPGKYDEAQARML
jgi:hypothetical protein